jgi:hypothetical protein
MRYECVVLSSIVYMTTDRSALIVFNNLGNLRNQMPVQSLYVVSTCKRRSPPECFLGFTSMYRRRSGEMSTVQYGYRKHAKVHCMTPGSVQVCYYDDPLCIPALPKSTLTIPLLQLLGNTVHRLSRISSLIPQPPPIRRQRYDLTYQP